MEVSASRSSSRCRSASPIGALGGLINGAPHRRAPASTASSSRWRRPPSSPASISASPSRSRSTRCRRRWSPSATQRFGAFPYLLVAPLIVAALLGVFFSRTVPGRQLLADGGNATGGASSPASPRERVIVLAHVLSGTLAAIAAVLAVAQLGSAQPTIGADWLLLSFAAPMIGGAVLHRRHISVLGTMFAVVLIALIKNGMVLAKVDPYWVQFVLGALILAAVWSQPLARRADRERPEMRPRDRERQQVLPRRSGARRRLARPRQPARSTRCWARTAPASRR